MAYVRNADDSGELFGFIVNVVPGFNCKKGPVLQSIPVSYSFPETLKLLRIVTP